MLMSDMAVRELENGRDTFFDSCRRAFVRLFGRTSDHQLPPELDEPQPFNLRSVPKAPAGPRKLTAIALDTRPASADSAAQTHQWRRHPQLRLDAERLAVGGNVPRSARLEAERAMILARGGKFADAVEAFTTAASAPEVDLTALPGFWDLPRQGMTAAVKAYEANHRIRDAAALEARIRHTLRPRALKPLPAGKDGRRLTASGE